MKKILGISCFYHDSAASIIIDSKIVAAVQEERFTRDKHTSEFPINSIKYCLQESGYELDELDAIVFYDKPLLKFERILNTYLKFAPKGLKSFLLSIPIWAKEKIYLKKMILEGLNEVGEYDKSKIKLLFTEHHLSHASSSFFSSTFKEAAILTIDGVGEYATVSMGYGFENNISFNKELHFPNSLGLLYSAFTYYLWFTVNSGEYKLMGLAPYGDQNSNQVSSFIEIIKNNLVKINQDGSINLNQKYFNYAVGLTMVNDKKWLQIFGIPKRLPESEINQAYCNLALAIQIVTEEIVIKMAQHVKILTNSDNLCLAGGVALNCVSNAKLLETGIFKNIYIQPASGDAGGALGAALAANYIYFGLKRDIDQTVDLMNGTYLGPYYCDKEIEVLNKKVKAKFELYQDFNELSNFIAQKISEGNVIGWFQGRMEFGPRSLGNRSILADPRNIEMQKKLNLKIKQREGFRPFAPSVLKEDCQLYFNLNVESPYMLLVAKIKESLRRKLPDNYSELGLWDKLYFQRSTIQSVTHLDFSARVQTVSEKTNPRYWNLLNSFKKITGIGMLVNTSFNVRGEPIVCSPLDAYYCFMNTEMDFLVINNLVYKKEEQSDYSNKSKWSKKFKLD